MVVVGQRSSAEDLGSRQDDSMRSEVGLVRLSDGAFDQQGLRASPRTDDRVGHSDLREGFREVVLGVREVMADLL